MENRQQQILSEIKEMMSSIRMQLEQLDAKMAELQYEVDPQDFNMEPIDIQLDDSPVGEPMVVETEIETAVEVETVEDTEQEEEEQTVVEDDLPEADDDLPFFEEPEATPLLVAEPAPAPVPVSETPTVHEVAQNIAVDKPAVIDSMTAKQAWRTDMPGAAVRDIRSAISLNDRVLFINRLFDEDPVSFQEALTAINQMSSLDEAVEYLAGSHPSWDFDSELVYRFMMAIRRKIS